MGRRGGSWGFEFEISISHCVLFSSKCSICCSFLLVLRGTQHEVHGCTRILLSVKICPIRVIRVLFRLILGNMQISLSLIQEKHDWYSAGMALNLMMHGCQVKMLIDISSREKPELRNSSRTSIAFLMAPLPMRYSCDTPGSCRITSPG